MLPSKPVSLFNSAVLLALLVASSVLRMRGLFSNGIIGADTYQYWDIALLWSNGELVLNNDPNEYRQYFRPIFYLVNLISVKLFGVHDYAIRLGLGIVETLNVLLAVLVGRYFLKSFYLGILVGALYASVPSGIILSQVELPHSLTTTFTLLMFLAFLIADSKRQDRESPLPIIWVALSGLFAGCAATTHGSTTFFGPIMVLFLLIDSCLVRSVTIGARTKRFVTAAGTFTVCFFVNYLIWGALIGYEYMVHAILSESEIRSNNPANPLKLFMTIAHDGPESASKLIMYLFYGSSIYLLGAAAFRKLGSWVTLTPLLVILLFNICFALTFENVFYTRLYLPLNIFLLLPIGWAFSHALSLVPKPVSYTILTVAVGYLAVETVQTKWGTVMELYNGERRQGPKSVYGLIGDKTGPESKLLVAPYIVYHHRPQFKAEVYFGENVHYLVECQKRRIGHFVKRNKIRYLFISKDLDKRIVTSNAERYKKLGTCTGLDRAQYDIEQDLAFIRDYLNRVGAERMDFPEQYGELYTLPQK